MNELCFENLNFDDLIYLSEKEKQSAIDKTIIYSTEYNGEIDYFKAADKRLSVLFEKLSKDNTYAELSKARKKFQLLSLLKSSKAKILLHRNF